MRRIAPAVVALLLALLAAGVALLPLTTPTFTRALSSRYSLAREAGFSEDRMASIAEQVRAFVVDSKGELPERVDGRPGFDRAAVSHLEDVRRVLAAANLAAGLVAGAVALWVGLVVARRDHDQLVSALHQAAWMTLAVVALAVVAAVSDFETFFSAFHSLFFASGTWLFPEDSLLIRTFPEPFWIWSGVAWGVGTLVVALGYRVLAIVLGRGRTANSDNGHAA